jgi:hypothetical protein
MFQKVLRNGLHEERKDLQTPLYSFPKKQIRDKGKVNDKEENSYL